MKTIKRLPKNVHSSLRSSTVLSDLPRVVEELIYNSIDANASKIDIEVNVRGCYVKVEDDGCGITRDELVLLGEKYATSKFHNTMELSSRTFGLNGEALASLSDISVVEGSKCLHLGIDDQREFVGTTVIVRELFYNQPVRRKQMQSSERKELHHVKKCVLQIALVHPQVSLRLIDTDSEDELLYTTPSSSPLALISNSFGDNVSSCLHEIAISDQDWVLSGHISGPTDLFCTKYLYINSRFVSRNQIHNMINNLAASFQSSMTKRDEEIGVQSRKRQKADVYPAYLLNLSCPTSSYDLHFEPTKTIVEFKDWQTVLFFLEQTVTNHWKKRTLQSPKVKAADGASVPLKKDVKSSLGHLKHHTVQSKEDYADLQSIQQKDAVRVTSIDMDATAALKDLQCFSFDMEPSIRHICFSERITNASQRNDNVSSIDYKIDHKQTHCAENGSYWWLEDGPFQLEEDDLRVNPTDRKRRRTEGIYHEYVYSGNFGKSAAVPIEGFLTCDEESGLIPEIEIQEPCSRALSRPNRMTCDFVQNQTNVDIPISGWDGFNVEFDKLNKDCVLGQATETITDISYPEMLRCSDKFYHDNSICSTSSGFCTVLKRCSTSKKLGTAAGCLEDLEADAVTRINFPDIHAMLDNDFMDRSSAKNTVRHFSHPFSLIDTPGSHAKTGFKLHSRSNKIFGCWSTEDMDSDFRFTSASFSNDLSIICEGTENLDNFDNEIQPLSYLNNYCSTADQLVSEDDLITWKSKCDARLTIDISPERSASRCHLNVPSSQMANGRKITEDLLNQQNFRCNQRSRPSKGCRSRSHSAPPFYRGKQKFYRLNELLSKSTKDICNNDLEDTAPTPLDISGMNATQPIPETGSSEFPDLDFSSNAYVKMCEDACSDELEDSTAQITKWRDDSGQHTALELPHGPLGCYDDVLSISSGTLHISCSSLVPEYVDKNCFEEARVLLQLDKKFIPVVSGEMILLVDQHAADERIRLEELRSKVLSEEGRAVTYLDSEEELSLPETGFQLFQKYAEQIQKWGWIINSRSNSSESFKKNMNIMRRHVRLVTLVAVPCILGVNLTGKDLMEFIHQLDETDGSSAIPQAVLRILNSKACRGAIMFGDSLLPSECSLIIEELKATSLCFQCAHGRPTTVPIVNVSSLHDELARLKMLNGKQAETWHGLAHQGPSLERAQARLKQLRRLRRGL
ncbi:hypothetical protein ACP70R_044831 [Stipagrostis hirtigluma subsp. patula]